MLDWKPATRGHKCFSGDILLDFYSGVLYQHLFDFQNVSNNDLQSAGAEYVAKMLLDNISLKSIKLSGNVQMNNILLYWQ